MHGALASWRLDAGTGLLRTALLASCSIGNFAWRLGYLAYLGSGAGQTRVRYLAILLVLAILLGLLGLLAPFQQPSPAVGLPQGQLPRVLWR